MALGDFSPSNLYPVLAAVKETALDSEVAKRHRLFPKHNILKIIKEQDTASIESVRPNDRKCEDFYVSWLEESNNEATISTGQNSIHLPPCAITGEQLQSQRQQYGVHKVVEYTFQVNDDDCGNMFDTGSKVALAFLQGEKKLIERLAKAMPAYLAALASDNAANGVAFMGNIGEDKVTSNVTVIDNTKLTANQTIPYLTWVAELNQYQDPTMIDGGLFFQDRFLAAAQAGTYAGDVGNENFWGLVDYNQDLFNMNRGGFLSKAFTFERGTIALPMVSFFPRLGNNNEFTADKYIYSLPMSGITLGGMVPVMDVTYTKQASEVGTSDRCELVHTFNLQLKFDLWQNPKYSTQTTGGLIVYEAGTIPIPAPTP